MKWLIEVTYPKEVTGDDMVRMIQSCRYSIKVVNVERIEEENENDISNIPPRCNYEIRGFGPAVQCALPQGHSGDHTTRSRR